jgi:hypothetical protein
MATPIFLFQLSLNFLSSAMGMASIQKSRITPMMALAQPMAFRVRHFPSCPPSHWFQNRLMGEHWKMEMKKKMMP